MRIYSIIDYLGYICFLQDYIIYI